MKDIDFDELDRAVGSILTSSDTSATDTKPTVNKTDDTAATSPVNARSLTEPVIVTRQESSPKPSVSIPTRKSTPAVRRSSGRFMDVVHPSSDMKTKTSDTPVTKRAKLAPISPDMIPTTSADSVGVAATDMTDTESPIAPIVTAITDTIPEAPQATDTTLVSEPTWPDPLDVMGNQSTDASDKVAASEDAGTESASTDVDEQEVESSSNLSPELAAVATDNPSLDEESSQTPFLTDAKVNKRPLGAFGLNEEVVETDTQNAEEVVDDKAVETGVNPVEQTPPQQPLPPELQPDAVKAESMEVSEAKETELPADKPSARVTAPALTQSISPQYQATEDDDEDEQTRALFDTQDYHQPLIPAHAGTSKGKRILITVLMTALLLAVGAAIGYAAYVYNIGL